MKRPLVATLIMLSLAGCGVVYNSPTVTQEVTDAGVKVRVVPMTSETVLAANRSFYSPREIPSALGFPNVSGPEGQTTASSAEPVFLDIQPPVPVALRAPPPVVERPYRIGVGDVVQFASPAGGSTVEQLTGILAAQTSRQGFTVQDDGAIAIPNAGRVMLAGMTLDEAEGALFNRLVEVGMEPAFSLSISAFNSKRVTVDGAVRTPSILPITLSPLTLREALLLAGGVTDTPPEYVTIRISREEADYQIPLTAFRAEKDLQTTRLLAGDAIFVETSFDRNSARASFDQAMQLGAVDMDYVYLAGEVGQQSRVSLPFERTASLADVLYGEGGGFRTQAGNPRHIYVLRGESDPRDFAGLTAYNLDALNAANLLLATRFELRPNDVIFIAEQPVTRWNRALSLIIPSFVINATGVN